MRNPAARPDSDEPAGPRATAFARPSPTTAEIGHFAFIDYLRVAAASLVLWDHVVASWPARHGVEFRAVAFVRRTVTEPLGIIQDFGWFAVVLFFIISGFVITHVSRRETLAEFTVKRVLRIYPLLIATVLLAVSLQPDLVSGPSDLLLGMSLLNYAIYPQKLVVGVAWTLAIEMLFYGLTALTLSFRAPRASALFNIAVSVAAVAMSRADGPNLFLLAASLAYVPYLVTGQILYHAVYRREWTLGFTLFASLSCLASLLYGLFTIHTAFLPVSNSYLISYAYAVAIFYVCLREPSLFANRPWMRVLANGSFSVYLIHGVVGAIAFEATVPVWGIRAAVFAALLATVLGSLLTYLLIERPAILSGRQIGRRLRSRAAPA